MIFPVNFFAILANLIFHLIHAEMPYCASNSSIRKPSAKDFPVPTSHFSTKSARQTVRMMTYLIGRGQEVWKCCRITYPSQSFLIPGSSWRLDGMNPASRATCMTYVRMSGALTGGNLEPGPIAMAFNLSKFFHNVSGFYIQDWLTKLSVSVHSSRDVPHWTYSI